MYKETAANFCTRKEGQAGKERRYQTARKERHFRLFLARGERDCLTQWGSKREGIGLLRRKGKSLSEIKRRE